VKLTTREWKTNESKDRDRNENIIVEQQEQQR